MKTTVAIIALIAAALLSGCATVKKDIASGVAGDRIRGVANVALNVGAMAQPQYAGTIKQLQRLLDPPSNTAADDGMAPFEEWYFKGTVIDKNDLSIHRGREEYVKPTVRDLAGAKSGASSTDADTIAISRSDLRIILDAVTTEAKP